MPLQRLSSAANHTEKRPRKLLAQRTGDWARPKSLLRWTRSSDASNCCRSEHCSPQRRRCTWFCAMKRALISQSCLRLSYEARAPGKYKMPGEQTERRSSKGVGIQTILFTDVCATTSLSRRMLLSLLLLLFQVNNRQRQRNGPDLFSGGILRRPDSSNQNLNPYGIVMSTANHRMHTSTESGRLPRKPLPLFQS